MNKRVMIAVGLLLGLVAILLVLMPEPVHPVRVGDMAKPISLPTLQGDIQGLPEGKVVLLNFWATWCPPCRKEVPSMVKVYDKFKDRGFEIVAVSVDKQRDDVVKFVQEYGMNFTVLHDVNSTFSASYGVFRFPESYIIDRKGIVRQHIKGEADWMKAEFSHYIDKLLDESVSSQPSKL